MVWTQWPWVRMTPGRPAQQGSEWSAGMPQARGRRLGGLTWGASSGPSSRCVAFSTAAPGDGRCHSAKQGPRAQRGHAPAQGRPAAKCPGVARSSASWLSAWIPASLESLRRLPPQPTPYPPRPFPGPALNCNPEDPHWSLWTGSASHPGLWLWRPRAGLCNCPMSL